MCCYHHHEDKAAANDRSNWLSHSNAESEITGFLVSEVRFEDKNPRELVRKLSELIIKTYAI